MSAMSFASSGDARAGGAPLSLTILCVFLALLLPAVSMLADPMIRHDDYPALLAQPEFFYSKTLQEGRWLNYLWHLRGVITPAWFNFLIYNLFWAIYLGVLAHLSMGASAPIWRKLYVAIIAGLAMPQILISLWFNTLIPGLGCVAIYALLTVWLNSRQSRALLLLFVPLTLTAYTTYPFLLLALHLLRHDVDRSWRDLFALLGLFLVSLALGLLMINTLNYFEHGIFGLQMASWRNPHPAQDLASFIENLAVVRTFLDGLVVQASYGFLWAVFVQAALVLTAIYVVARKHLLQTAYPIVGLILCLSMILAQGVKEGIDLPIRSGGFVWIYYAVFLGWLAHHLQALGQGRMAHNLLFIVAAAYVAVAFFERQTTNAWPKYSRQLAEDIGTGPEPLLITGTYRSLPAAKASQLQSHLAVKSRLELLTQRQVRLCEFDPEACSSLPGDLLAGLSPSQIGTLHAIKQHDGNLVLLLSPQELMPEKAPEN